MTIFAVSCFVSGRPRQALAWLLVTALIHPQMSIYGAVFLGCLWVVLNYRRHPKLLAAPAMATLAVFPFPFSLQPAHGVAREVLFSRGYFFVSNWAWYEWIGVIAPLALAWWCSSRMLQGTTPVFRSLLRTVVPFGLLFTVAGVALTCSPHFENFARLQPMRSFHVVYVIFFVLLGGLLGEFVLRKNAWRWFALFAPLSVSMFFLQQSQFPNSPHVEWPGYSYSNAWNTAFSWIRIHTPKDAVFALNPNYMLLKGEDQHGFRAIAERSALADAVKDSGAVSLFPGLANDWKNQVQAEKVGSDLSVRILSAWRSSIRSLGFSPRAQVRPV